MGAPPVQRDPWLIAHRTNNERALGRVLRSPRFAGVELDLQAATGIVAHEVGEAGPAFGPFIDVVAREAVRGGAKGRLPVLLDVKGRPSDAVVGMLHDARDAHRDVLQIRLVSFRPEWVLPWADDVRCFVFVHPDGTKADRVTWHDVPALDPRLGVHVRLHKFRDDVPSHADVVATGRPYALSGWRRRLAGWDVDLGGVWNVRNLKRLGWPR